MTFTFVHTALDDVAEELFGLSEPFLFRVAEDSSFARDVPSSIQEELEGDRYAERIKQMREVIELARVSDPEAHTSPSAATLVPVESTVGMLHATSRRPPAAGEMRRVCGVDLNHPESPSRYSKPLAVLLDEPYVGVDGAQVAGAWRGWVVSSFSEFATWWDVVLQGDTHPDAYATVQVWNRVVIAEAHLSSRVHVVTPTELQSIRAVWDEYAAGDEPEEDVVSAVGYLNLRQTLGGLAVVTGTPLRSDDDPRVVFQSFYLRASDIVSAAARTAFQAQQDVSADGKQALAERAKAALIALGLSAIRLVAEAILPVGAGRASGRVELVRLTMDDEYVDVEWNETDGAMDIRPMRFDDSPLTLCVLDSDSGELVEIADENEFSATYVTMKTARRRVRIKRGGVPTRPVFMLFAHNRQTKQGQV